MKTLFSKFELVTESERRYQAWIAIEKKHMELEDWGSVMYDKWELLANQGGN